MIKNGDMVLSGGQMAENTLELGKTVNNMVKVYTMTEMEEREKVLGKMAKESIGQRALQVINENNLIINRF